MMSMMSVVLLDHRSQVNCRLLLLFDEVKLFYSSIVHRIKSHISVSFTHSPILINCQLQISMDSIQLNSIDLNYWCKMHKLMKNNALTRFV